MTAADPPAEPGVDAAPPAATHELATVLRELAWTIHRAAPDRAGVGPLPTTEIALLKQIIDAPGSTIGELSIALALRQPNTSKAVRALEARGLVAREAAPDDRRLSRVVVTTEGAAEHRAIAEAWIEPVERAVDGLRASERRTLQQAVDALRSLHDELRAP